MTKLLAMFIFGVVGIGMLLIFADRTNAANTEIWVMGFILGFAATGLAAFLNQLKIEE